MNRAERQQLIRQNVLRILNDCGGYLLPEPRLIESLGVAVMPPPTQAECEAEIKWLEADAFIKGITPELGGPRKWTLTDKGRLAIS